MIPRYSNDLNGHCLAKYIYGRGTRYNPDKPLLCEQCEHYNGRQYYPNCIFFASEQGKSFFDANGDGTDAIIANDFVRVVFRRLHKRPEYNIIFCNAFSKSRRIKMKEYYLSASWKRIRKEKLREADYQCERCGSAINLNVHHTTYDNLGNENLDDLVVLCASCHAQVHGLKPEDCYE